MAQRPGSDSSNVFAGCRVNRNAIRHAGAAMKPMSMTSVVVAITGQLVGSGATRLKTKRITTSKSANNTA